MNPLIHDPMIHKLGKLPAVHLPGMRMMAEVTHKLSLPEPPSAVAWYKGFPTPGGYVAPITDWQMMGNDRAGDCVFAGAGHLDLLWTSVTGTPLILSDEQVLAEYSRLTGYDPADPKTDQGACEADIWQAWQDDGLWGRKIDGFVGVNPASQIQVKDAVWFFGAALLGIDLPKSAQKQTVWDVPAGGPSGDGKPGSWGGHCTLLVGAGARGVTMVTWGALKEATWEFMETYCEEAYALLSPMWLEKSGVSPGGVPLASLQQDLGKIIHA